MKIMKQYFYFISGAVNMKIRLITKKLHLLTGGYNRKTYINGQMLDKMKFIEK